MQKRSVLSSELSLISRNKSNRGWFNTKRVSKLDWAPKKLRVPVNIITLPPPEGATEQTQAMFELDDGIVRVTEVRGEGVENKLKI